MLEFCGNKGIKQEYSNARTPQQNGVGKRMNRALIEAARTMLVDSLLLTTFWAEAEKDEDVELIVVPSAVKNTKEKVESRTSSAVKNTKEKVKSRTSSTNSKKEEILKEPQQEKEASSTDTS
ncbi:putative ribonuclease H-like domain-containing protein [Tanacetum coccineum]